MSESNNVKKSVLDNGVRLLSEPVDYVRSVAIGVWVQTGSRCERDGEAGISHILEHMLFKGTKTRTAKEIAEEIEGRGGGLNAFTDKEFTCFFARTLADDLPVAIDVLTDMLLNSLLDPEELQRELQVILEEIKHHEDQPEDLVHDLYLQAIWDGHPLAKPVIGTSESVAGMSRDAIMQYIARRYASNHIVVSVAGNHDTQALQAMVEERLGGLAPTEDEVVESSPFAKAVRKLESRDIEQVHFCLGGPGFGQHDDRKYAMAVLDTILGGSMSSRLFQEIREKRGLAYAIGSYAASYAEGGVLTVYGGTSLTNFEQVQDLTRAEFDKVTSEALPDDEIEKAKNQLRGNMVLGLEGMSSRMTRMAKNELYFGRVIPLDETVEKVNAVTPEAVHEAGQCALDQQGMALVALGPFEH